MTSYTQIIKYWTIEQRNNWFTSSGSNSQKQLDSDIKNRYRQTLYDIESWYLTGYESNYFSSWTNNPHGLLAIIIVLDQFSRHIYRNRNEHELKLITRNDQWALIFCLKLFEYEWMDLLTDSQYIFACMPLRHSANPSLVPDNSITNTDRLSYLRFLLKSLENRSELQRNNIEAIDRFRRVTIEKQSQMYRVIGTDTPAGNNYLDLNSEFSYGDFSLEDIVDKDALEYSRFDYPEPNTTLIKQENLYETITKFVTTIENRISEDKYFFVSLSGGVDSMTVAYLLNSINPDFHRVVAIHINYGNRNESSAETAFVERWCSLQKPPIIFRKKCMDPNLRRGVTPREEYEQKTKMIRFNIYKEVMNEFSMANSGIYVGHNCDDVQENVISNIVRRGNILELSGMYPSNVINNVRILRPFLHTQKKSIFEFAHRYHIPYHKDTTPRYCIRGMFRHELTNLLKRMYGEQAMESLNVIADQSNELYKLTDEHIWKPVLSNVHGYKGTIQRIRTTLDHGYCEGLGLWLDYRPYVNHSVFFWKEILAMMCHSMGIGQISEKMINGVLLPAMNSRKKKSTQWLNFRKDLNGCLHQGYLYIIPNVNDEFNMNTPLSLDTKYNLGRWVVELRKVITTYQELVNKKVDFNDIMSGSFHYYLPYHDNYIIGNTKKLIPPVFQGNGLDKRMKNMIPIVCIDAKNKDLKTINSFVRINVKM